MLRCISAVQILHCNHANSAHNVNSELQECIFNSVNMPSKGHVGIICIHTCTHVCLSVCSSKASHATGATSAHCKVVSWTAAPTCCPHTQGARAMVTQHTPSNYLMYYHCNLYTLPGSGYTTQVTLSTPGPRLSQQLWSVLGSGFWSEAGAAGRQKYRFRERVSARNTIRPEPVCMCSGTHFHTPKLMFWANVPDNWSTVCALFPWSIHETFMKHSMEHSCPLMTNLWT